MSQEVLSSQDEFDVSDAASIPKLIDAVTTITEFEIVEKDNGTLHQLTYEAEGLPFPVRKGYWFTHSNEKAQGIGRGQLKRISLAATDSPRYTSTSLVGRQILADISEDDSGFAQIKRIRKYAGVVV